MKTLKEYTESAINGEVLESVEMGGISEGYENAIQHLANCIIISLADIPVPESKEERSVIVTPIVDKWAKTLDSQHGFSGAQVGAARNLATVFWAKTPEVALNEMRNMDAQRIIKVKNYTLQP